MCRTVAGHKVRTRRSLAVLYTNGEHVQLEIENEVPLTPGHSIETLRCKP